MDWISQYLPQLIYWAVTGVLAVACGAMAKKIGKVLKESEAMRDGVISILRNNLYRVSQIYIDQGYCPMSAKRDIESIYEPYKKMGGNGTGKAAFEAIMALPTEPPEK